MILNHIAIIVSSNDCLDFYKDIGFIEYKRIDRDYDEVVYLKHNDIRLEIFIDSKHPNRLSEPETLGLRHIAFDVDNIEEIRNRLSKYNPEDIRVNEISRFFFAKDLDGQPIEFRDYNV